MPRWSMAWGWLCPGIGSPEGVAVGQVLEGFQGARVVLAQRVAQCIDMAVTGPNQPLMGPCEHLDRLGVGAVAGNRAVVVPVRAHQIGQHLASEASDLAPETCWRSR